MKTLALSLAALFFSVAAHANPSTPTTPAAIGKPAPGFELTDTDGKTVKLSQFAGKVVVLEWFNPDCPFVKYAHGNGPLKDMAARMEKKGAVWLAINSNAAGKQGHGKERNAKARADWKLSHPILLDEKGTVGKAYGAKKTPHMFVIDAKGNLAYAGALDNAPIGEVEGGKPLEPHTERAVDAVLAKKAPPAAEVPPYGCSVKYAD